MCLYIIGFIPQWLLICIYVKAAYVLLENMENLRVDFMHFVGLLCRCYGDDFFARITESTNNIAISVGSIVAYSLNS